MNIILLGPPGSGKGTQSSKIIHQFGFFHISTGDIIRDNINNQTEYGIKSQEYVEKGKLIPYSLIIDMISEILSQNRKIENIVWDGFPRTIPQAKLLDELLENRKQKIDLVFHLKLEHEVALGRITNRVVCLQCKRSYNLKYNKPIRGNYCDYDNSFLFKRTDDDIQKFKVRIEQYSSETKKLLSYYKNKVVEIDANDSSTIVWKQIKDIINEYN